MTPALIDPHVDLAPALLAAVAAEWDRLERQRTAALTALADSAELREHGTRLLATLSPRGGRRG